MPLPRIAVLLYAAALLGANPAPAQQLTAEEREVLTALRQGEMRKLTLLETPQPAPDTPYIGPDGEPTSLPASNGKVRLLNFWATWCAPCREEMPALDALQAERGGKDFEVIAVATGRNSPEAIARFWEETGVTALETGLDPKSELAAAMNVPGLPVTIVLNREGAEVARMLGGADWNGPSARAIIDHLIALPEQSESQAAAKP